jgi:hypothetical protein
LAANDEGGAGGRRGGGRGGRVGACKTLAPPSPTSPFLLPRFPFVSARFTTTPPPPSHNAQTRVHRKNNTPQVPHGAPGARLALGALGLAPAAAAPAGAPVRERLQKGARAFRSRRGLASPVRWLLSVAEAEQRSGGEPRTSYPRHGGWWCVCPRDRRVARARARLPSKQGPTCCQPPSRQTRPVAGVRARTHKEDARARATSSLSLSHTLRRRRRLRRASAHSPFASPLETPTKQNRTSS